MSGSTVPLEVLSKTSKSKVRLSLPNFFRNFTYPCEEYPSGIPSWVREPVLLPRLVDSTGDSPRQVVQILLRSSARRFSYLVSPLRICQKQTNKVRERESCVRARGIS